MVEHGYGKSKSGVHSESLLPIVNIGDFITPFVNRIVIPIQITATFMMFVILYMKEIDTKQSCGPKFCEMGSVKNKVCLIRPT